MKNGLTVFLCSTYSDLTEERQQILRAIQSLQLQQQSMEFFGARPNRAIDTCLEEVRQSDLLVVVVGHRYGSLVPGQDLSFSQAEYEEGYRLGKPCLVYLRRDDVAVQPAAVEDNQQRRQRLDRWKATLRERHTVAEFSNPNDLALQVSADISRIVHSLMRDLGEDDTPVFSCPRYIPGTEDPSHKYGSTLHVICWENNLSRKWRYEAATGRALLVFEEGRRESRPLYFTLDEEDQKRLSGGSASLSGWFLYERVQDSGDGNGILKLQYLVDRSQYVSLYWVNYAMIGYIESRAREFCHDWDFEVTLEPLLPGPRSRERLPGDETAATSTAPLRAKARLRAGRSRRSDNSDTSGP